MQTPPPSPAAPMPPAGGPPGGAPPTPDDVMVADQSAAEQRMAAIAESAPTPEGGGVPVSDLENVEKYLNEVTGALNKAIGEEMFPRVMWDAGEVRDWQAQIPAELFVPVAALVGTAQQLGAKKYVYDPVKEFSTSGGVKGIAAKLMAMSEDEAFIRDASGSAAPGGGAGGDGGGAPELSPEDQKARDDLMAEAL